jgi:very-short-patch-repair endonuclease
MPTAFDKRHLTYRKALLAERAARMRHWGTPSERRLWDCLTNGKRGVPFRRQYVIGNRIADFAAPSIRLVIEVDGAAHHGRARADARKTRELERAGWRVVRIQAAHVMRDLADVLRSLNQMIEVARSW